MANRKTFGKLRFFLAAPTASYSREISGSGLRAAIHMKSSKDYR